MDSEEIDLRMDWLAVEYCCLLQSLIKGVLYGTWDVYLFHSAEWMK
jgi:hypothetical protein